MQSIKIIAPAVPWYRIDFFERLREQYPDLAVYSSQVRLAGFEEVEIRHWLHVLGPIRQLPFGAYWQGDSLNIPLKRGDVLVVTGEPRVLSLPLLLLRARWRKVKTIWWGHYWGATSRGWRLLARTLLMNMCDAIAVYNDAERYAAQTNPLLSRSVKIIGINNGVPRAPIVKRRHPYEARARGRRLLFIGRLTTKSELGLLLEALGRVDPNVMLDVVGGGEDEANLRQMAQRLEVDQRVKWHGALIDEDSIAEITNAARMFVYPGAVGLSLLHAMTYGLPALLHDNYREQMPEVAAFVPNVTGGNFRQGDVESLVDAIRLNIDDIDRLNETSRQSVALADQYGTDVMAVRLCELIKDLLRG